MVQFHQKLGPSAPSRHFHLPKVPPPGGAGVPVTPRSLPGGRTVEGGAAVTLGDAAEGVHLEGAAAEDAVDRGRGGRQWLGVPGGPGETQLEQVLLRSSGGH